MPIGCESCHLPMWPGSAHGLARISPVGRVLPTIFLYRRPWSAIRRKAPPFFCHFGHNGAMAHTMSMRDQRASLFRTAVRHSIHPVHLASGLCSLSSMADICYPIGRSCRDGCQVRRSTSPLPFCNMPQANRDAIARP